MAFGKHPSKKLQDVFKQKPYQMQCPEKAKIIFLGLDANWDEDIEEKSYFDEFIEYLNDGVKYWESNKDRKGRHIHTPMLRKFKNVDGRKGGRKYHREFRKLCFSHNNAKDICFIELLNVCTCGKSKESNESRKEFNRLLLDSEKEGHLERIQKLFEKENTICISKSISTILNDKLKFDITNGRKVIRTHLKDKKKPDTSSKNLIIHTHFSARGNNDNEWETLGSILKKYLEIFEKED